jgi:hypothetical protein
VAVEQALHEAATALARYEMLKERILNVGAGDGIRTHDPNLGKVVLLAAHHINALERNSTDNSVLAEKEQRGTATNKL